MRELEHVLALFVAAVLLAAAARRLGAPYPVFLAIGGARYRLFGSSSRGCVSALTGADGLLIAWSGMRGIVSLAAALALPAGFPHRDLIVLPAFSVVLGTLVVQGLTLKPLLSVLRLRDDDPVGREVRAARSRALRAGLASLANEHSSAGATVRQELTDGLAHKDVPHARHSQHRDIRRRALQAARQEVLSMRAGKEIGDDAGPAPAADRRHRRAV